jgi:hypothetical protein
MRCTVCSEALSTFSQKMVVQGCLIPPAPYEVREGMKAERSETRAVADAKAWLTPEALLRTPGMLVQHVKLPWFLC